MPARESRKSMDAPQSVVVAEVHIDETVEIQAHSPLQLDATSGQEIRLVTRYEAYVPPLPTAAPVIRFESNLGAQQDRPDEVRLVARAENPIQGTLLQTYDFDVAGRYEGDLRIVVSQKSSGHGRGPRPTETIAMGRLQIEIRDPEGAPVRAGADMVGRR